MSSHASRWLIALDLDGTLFQDDLVISPRIVATVAVAHALGHYVTLATGRSFAMVRPVAKQLGLDGAMITYQGAVVRSEQELAWQQTLPIAVAREVIRYAEERGLALHVYVGDGVFTMARTAETGFYEAMHPGERLEFVGPLGAFLTAEPIKLLFNLDPLRSEAVAVELAERLGTSASVVRSHSHYVEVTHREVNKGRALLALADRAAIPRAQTLAVGDNLNDLSMLQAASIGVAMGNAVPALKLVADWVAPSVREDGAAVAIERFILQRAASR